MSGVRVAGLLVQAGPLLADHLVGVGSDSAFSGDEGDPVVLSDLFARVGGPDGPEGVSQVMP